MMESEIFLPIRVFLMLLPGASESRQASDLAQQKIGHSDNDSRLCCVDHDHDRYRVYKAIEAKPEYFENLAAA